MTQCETCSNKTVEGKFEWCNNPNASVRVTIPKGVEIKDCKLYRGKNGNNKSVVKKA